MNHIPFGVVLSTFHMMPGQSLRFYGLQSWDRTNYLHILKMLLYPDELFAKNLPRCAVPVASQPFGLQNTTHLMSFALRATQPCFTDPVIPSSFALLHCLSLRVRLYSYPLVSSIR